MNAGSLIGPGDLLVADALREVASIGNGNAATALSRLLGDVRVGMSLAEYHAGSEIEELVDPAEYGFVISLMIDGVVAGTFLVLLPDLAATRTTEHLMARLRRRVETPGMAESALMEFGNIASCAFVGALAKMTRARLLPSPPRAVYGRLGDALRGATEGLGQPLAVSNRLALLEGEPECQLVYVTDWPGARALLSALQLRVR